MQPYAVPTGPETHWSLWYWRYKFIIRLWVIIFCEWKLQTNKISTFCIGHLLFCIFGYLGETLHSHCSFSSYYKLIQVRGAKISSKECTNQTGWFGAANCLSFLRISRPHKLWSTYRLLRWNLVAQPILLQTINPNSKTIFHNFSSSSSYTYKSHI